METQRRPARKKLAGGARKKRPAKKKQDTEASKGRADATGGPGKKPRKRKKRVLELEVIDKVLGRYKKQTAQDDFRVTTSEVAKLIQLKQEISGSVEEGGDVDLRFPEVPCLNSGSDS